MSKKNNSSLKMAPKSQKKIDDRTRICKEENCADPAAVKGFCRLHYIMNLKTLRAEKLNDKEGAQGLIKNKRERNRLEGPDSVGHLPTDWAPEEIVENIERVDYQPTTLLDTDDLDPFKKTGS